MVWIFGRDGLYELIPGERPTVPLPSGGYVDVGDIPHKAAASLYGLQAINFKRLKEIESGVELWLHYKGHKEDEIFRAGLYKVFKV